MKANMGSKDRTIRAIVATLIAVLYLTNVITGTLGLILLIAAVIFALTSLISVSPIYLSFGLSTCKPEESKETTEG